MVRIGINGFGRIGRALFRINLKHKNFKIVAINDIDNDVSNLAYLLKYDTTYSKLQNDKIEVNEGNIMENGNKVKVFCKENIADVPWSDYNVDIVFDSSGVFQNVVGAKRLIEQGIKKVIITHSPKEGVDFTYMDGVNEHQYNPQKHHIISSSICDANAVAPFYKLIDDVFGIEIAEVTTLHPWLSYQNLLDGNLKSVSSPGHLWKDYALGRSSIGSLIPKSTTLVPALEEVLPGISDIMHASSFRTPTSIVSAADGVFLLKETTSIEIIKDAINKYCIKFPKVLEINDRSLISIDYLANEFAAVLDTRWLSLKKGKMLKFVLWYDNEWGYSKRAYDIAGYIL
jgi:glyceraldehyde 3-phosphate dehydrogenase